MSNDNGAQAVREPEKGKRSGCGGDDMAGKHDLVYRPFGILTLAYSITTTTWERCIGCVCVRVFIRLFLD